MDTLRNRLKRAGFNNLFKKGKTITGELIFLKFRKNNFRTNRFGFIVSLKTSKKATIRNRIRRQLKEVIRNNLNNIKPGFDIVIVAKPEIINKKYQKIKNEVENLFKKSKIYRDT